MAPAVFWVFGLPYPKHMLQNRAVPGGSNEIQCYTNNSFPFQDSNEGCVLWNCENNALVTNHEQPNRIETINKIR